MGSFPVCAKRVDVFMQSRVFRKLELGVKIMMESLHHWIGTMGRISPLVCLCSFFLASFLIVWRLEVLSKQGVEGTVLGTLFMPFCSGMGNVVFAVVLALRGGAGEAVMVNCLFNNITNLTLLIGLPVLIWSMDGIPRKKSKKIIREFRIGRLSLSLNLVVGLFFTLILWALSRDGVVSFSDGVVLLASFAFCQVFHLYDVKKANLMQKKSYPKTLMLDVLLLLLGAGAVFISTDWLVWWFGTLDLDAGSARVLGWISGVLMVLPNALLAFYYGAHNRMDVVYTSQAGDAHMCIPFCAGLYAVFHPIQGGVFLERSLWILMSLFLLHLFSVVLFGRLPRWIAALLIAAFVAFLWVGFGG
ncbi:MAG: sodium/calcium exchanger protein [Pontiellaceae bacterium]|jgi:cation:H+ antiporter|nr:sodium/calcium exchanger protein [Pontiellaceae bacterium]